MATPILDPNWEQVLKAARDARNPYSRDEVWDGVLVVPPNANNEHQRMVGDLVYAVRSGMLLSGLDGAVLPGTNVSDRDEDWVTNYRDPDLAVYLDGNPAQNRDTHWVGGPDLLAEISSPGEDPRLKLGFYAKVNTREVLVIDRKPWVLELYQLRGSAMASAGRSALPDPAALASGVLPLTFRLRDGSPRPAVVVTHAGTGQVWTA